jgi:hypothetical protein
MIPSGVEAGTVFASKPAGGSADLTFTRSNDTATRVGPNGYIEKVRTNLILQSNSFDTTWINSNTTETGGQTDKDGGATAWKIDKSAALGYIRQAISQSGVQTLSVYAKKGTLNWMRILADGGTSTPSTWFDLENGVVGSADFFTIDSNIEAAGNGYYRCSISFEVGTIAGVRIYPADGNNNVSGTSGNIYIQDAQLEYNIVATNYIETTTAAASVGPLANVPRINFDPVLPRTGSLLLEPQRTNLVIYSEYYGTYSFFQSTLTSNNVVSPEGVQNGSTITITTQTTTQGMAGATITFDGTSNYTISGYYKKTTTSVKAQLKLRYAFASGTTYSLVDFNLNTGDITASLGENPSVVSFNSDWWYVSVTTSTPPVGTGRIIVRADNQPVSTEISVFGLQCEAGAYPTSYIPTYGVAVTRGADAASKTGISSVIGQTEGTLFFEYIPNVVSSSISQDWVPIGISDGTSNNSIYMNDYNDSLYFVIQTGGVTQMFYAYPNLIANNTYKIAIGYANNDAVVYINGTQVNADTSVSVPSMSKISLNSFTSPIHIGSITVNKILLFQTRLTNDQLSQITTL